MPTVSIRIPQLGEGLQEALLVDFLKQPGDTITQDEPIYVMETDKANTEVESPCAGTLVEWSVESGSAVAIGTVIGQIEVANTDKLSTDTPAAIDHHGAKDDTTEGRAKQSVPPSPALIPPKTRKLLKEHKLLERADEIPHAGEKLMPEDVTVYLATLGAETSTHSTYRNEPLPKSQIILNYRLERSARDCIPVTVMTDIDWTLIEATRAREERNKATSDFAIFCWAVVQALKKHPKFRSAINADGKSIRVFHHINLGVAVALPSDEMVTAVIKGADQLSADAFFTAFSNQVRAARDGIDQADETTTISISNIGSAGMRVGIPAIVAPAVATLAIGEAFAHPVPAGDSFIFKTRITATLCFDHRIVNGIGAARFMNDVKASINAFEI